SPDPDRSWYLLPGLAPSRTWCNRVRGGAARCLGSLGATPDSLQDALRERQDRAAPGLHSRGLRLLGTKPPRDGVKCIFTRRERNVITASPRRGVPSSQAHTPVTPFLPPSAG